MSKKNQLNNLILILLVTTVVLLGVSINKNKSSNQGQGALTEVSDAEIKRDSVDEVIESIKLMDDVDFTIFMEDLAFNNEYNIKEIEKFIETRVIKESEISKANLEKMIPEIKAALKDKNDDDYNEVKSNIYKLIMNFRSLSKSEDTDVYTEDIGFILIEFKSWKNEEIKLSDVPKHIYTEDVLAIGLGAIDYRAYLLEGLLYINPELLIKYLPLIKTGEYNKIDDKFISSILQLIDENGYEISVDNDNLYINYNKSELISKLNEYISDDFINNYELILSIKEDAYKEDYSYKDFITNINQLNEIIVNSQSSFISSQAIQYVEIILNKFTNKDSLLDLYLNVEKEDDNLSLNKEVETLIKSSIEASEKSEYYIIQEYLETLYEILTTETNESDIEMNIVNNLISNNSLLVSRYIDSIQHLFMSPDEYQDFIDID